MTVARPARYCAIALVLAAIALSASNPLPTYGPAQQQYIYTQQGRISESETADFNCDNRPDVILSNGVFQSGQNWPVNIALSNGTGGYVDGTSQIFNGTPVAKSEHLGKILIEDYNGDGRADIFIADSGIDGFPFTGRQNTLILSTPDCHLVDATANLPQQFDFTHSATTGDVDNDGDVDIYVGNIWGINTIPPQIWLNDGTGHFTIGVGLLPAAQTDLSQNRYTTSLFVDVNNDNNIDLVLGGENNTPQNQVLLNDGTGHLTALANALPAKPFAGEPVGDLSSVSNALPMDVKSTDFDHDGFADLAFEYTRWNPYYKGRWIQLLRNNGNGTFTDDTAMRLFPANNNSTLIDWFLFVHFADLEGDGNQDLIGQMVGTNNDNHRFYPASNAGVFTETPFLAGQLGDVFALVDARGDGHRDVLNTANIGNDQHRVSLLSNTGPILPPGIPQRVRASLNAGGHVRLWWPYVWGATGYQVWRSSTAGGAESLVTTVSTTSFDDTTMAAGSVAYYRIRAVNSVGTSDPSTVARALTSAPVNPLPTYGAAQQQYIYSLQPGRIAMSETADFNCDNRPDVILSNIVIQSGQSWPVNVALSNGIGGYVDGTTQIFGGTPVGRSEHLGKMLIEDYNGDGRADVFIADAGIAGAPYGRQNTLLLSTPDCHLVVATANLPQQSDSTFSATTGDVDNDGDVDIYIGNVWGANLIPPQIWLNNGTGHFTIGTGRLPAAQTDLNQARYTTSLLVDVDNDYDVDLVLGGENFPTPSVVLLNDGTGHFSVLPNALPAKPFSPLAIALDVKSSDFNHDGFADLAVQFTKDSSYQGRWIQLLRNNGNGTFTDESATRLVPTQVNNTLTWLLLVHFVDFDGDGNHDLIGQMVGINNDNHRFYQASNSGVFTEKSILAGQLGDVFGLVDARGDGHRDVLNTSNIGNDQHRVSLISNTGAILPPGIPQAVRASRNIGGQVRLWWPYVWGATGYQVWRSSTPGGAESLVTTVSSTSVLDAAAPAGTAAYYRVRAVNSAGTSGSSVAARALPPPPPPTVVTTLATSITASGAKLNGTANPNGNSTTAIFDYGKTTSYGSQVAATPAPGSGNAPVAVSATIGGLSCNTAYHFRAAATNVSGTTNGTDAVFTTGVCPALTADPLSLRFAAAKNGAGGAIVNVTPSQILSVSVASGAQSWTASADKTWIGLTNASGTGSGQMTVAIINPLNVLGGSTSATATITVTSGALEATVTVNLEVDLTGGTAPKGVSTGQIDSPAQNAVGLAGAIAVTGWAIDTIGLQKVQIWRNCVKTIDPANACTPNRPGGPADFVFIADAAFLSGARPDVEKAFPTTPQNYKAGWGYLMSTNALPHLLNNTPAGGQGQYTLSAYAINVEGTYTSLGSKTITLDNDHATDPFGALDTPSQGGLVTTNVFASFGWAMTQIGKCIDTTSTASYKVYIDGVSLPLTPNSNWIAGIPRSDIAAAYPGLCNTNNALAAYYIDAAALGLSNGLHTTGWDVFDDKGNAAGIGSRFFNLLIGSSVTASDVPSDADVVSGLSRTTTNDDAMVRLKPDTTYGINADRPVALGEVRSLDLLAATTRAIRLQVGPDSAPTQTLTPDARGAYRLQFGIGGRVALDLGGPADAGSQVVGDELLALPVGSTFDATHGTFAWQPPVPFFGPFHLVFTHDHERIDVHATIVDPTIAAPIAMHIDTPAADSTVTASLVIAGWAIDPLATTGSGIDTLHMWAYRRDGVAEPQFLGAAAVGGLRPDIAASRGRQFDHAGFTLTTPSLAPGVYDLVVYPWSRRTGRFEPAESVRVVVH